MIHAAMVTPNLSLGVAERWLTDLIVHSDPTRLQWTGVAISGYGGADEGLVNELRAVGVPLICSDPGTHRPAHAKPFYREGMTTITGTGVDFSEAVKLAAVGADILVTWGSPDMGRWLGWFDGPRVLVSHTTMSDRPGIAITGATHLAAVSSAAARYFDQFTGNDLPLKIIYNGVRRERCLPNGARHFVRTYTRDMWNIPQDAIVVGYVGRQTEEKNFLAAARAVGQLDEKHYAVYYGTDGTGQRPDDGLRTWCRNHIPGRFRLNMPVSDVGDVYAALDVLVLASHREACSLVLLEAWHAGVPVVATPVGSVPEMEEEFGRMVTKVRQGAADAELGQAVTEALAAREIARRAADVASRELTVERMVDRWATYLTALVEE